MNRFHLSELQEWVYLTLTSMADNTLIVLHLKTNDRTFDFFLLSLAVYDILLYDKDYNANAPVPELGGTSNDSYKKLRDLFIDAPDEEDAEIAVSFRHLLMLLSITDHISKGLLDWDADRMITYVGSKFPNLPEDWVTGYLQNAGQIFGSFRQQYGELKGMEGLLERLMNLNEFQGKG